MKKELEQKLYDVLLVKKVKIPLEEYKALLNFYSEYCMLVNELNRQQEEEKVLVKEKIGFKI